VNEEDKKKMGDNWQGQIDREKKEAQDKQEKYHEPTFTIFLSSVSMQAMIAMGKIDNPVTGKAEKSLEQARFLIDTLGILKDKTKGNLSSDEERLLDDSLFNLRMMYVDDKKEE
jgi:hypothetical protein